MEIRTFRAASLQEALEQVRSSLGPDASVLQTREVKRSRLGLFPQRMVEVEASAAELVNAGHAAQRKPLAIASRDESQAAQGQTLPSDTAETQTSTALHSDLVGERPARRLRAGRKSSATASPVNRIEADGDSTTAIDIQAAMASDGEESDPRKLDLETEYALPKLPIPANASSPVRGSAAPSRLPASLFETLSELMDAGVDPAEAKQLVQTAAQHCTPEQLEDAWLVKGRMVQLVGADLRVASPIEVSHGQPQIVALIGPTGVGKTTTLAKLAARFHFDQGCRVGFITLDTFRPGAVDQLLQYAELLNASLEVVSSADQFLPALQRLKGCDFVLIDTAGRSPTDTEQISVLRSTLLAAQPTSVQLVVSATSSAGHIRATMKQFASLEPTGLVITKMDEAVGFGSWLSILRNSELPVSYLAHGQQVPQDIAVANRRRLASLVLGHANHHSSTMLA